MFVAHQLQAQLRYQEKIDSLLELLPAQKEDTNKAAILILLNRAHFFSRSDKGIPYGKQALSLSTKLKWTLGMAKANEILGRSYFKLRTDYPRALSCYLASLELNKQLNNKNKIAETAANIGIIYMEQSNYAMSLKYFDKSLVLFMALADTNGMTKNLSNIGIVHELQGADSTALDLFMNSLQMSRQIGDGHGIAKSAGHIGGIYTRQKNYKQAINYFAYALAAAEDEHAIRLRIFNLCNIGSLFLGIATDTQFAFETAGKIRMPATANGNLHAFQYHDKASLIRGSIVYFEMALKLAKKLNEPKRIQQCYEGLSRAYKAQGNYKKALEFSDLYRTIYDTVFSKENKQKVARMQIQFETKLKDEKIAEQNAEIAYSNNTSAILAICTGLFLALTIIVLINRKKVLALNKTVNEQKANLEELNGVKDTMMSVISHDLRTPVATLTTFTHLLDGKDLTTEELKNYTSSLKNSLDNTADLMNNLLNWALTHVKGYNPVMEEFDLTENIKPTIESLRDAAEKKQLSIVNNIPTQTMVYADINMTQLLARNLLSNAIKFTSPGGAITLSAQAIPGAVEFSMTDTGIGISEDSVATFNDNNSELAIDSTRGTLNEKGTGLGLMLCKVFAKQMGGRISLQSELGKGSIFTVSFAPPPSKTI